jgi:hypothetical protein
VDRTVQTPDGGPTPQPGRSVADYAADVRATCAELGIDRLAAHIPGPEARLFDHDRHLTLLTNRVPEVHAWLKERL